MSKLCFMQAVDVLNRFVDEQAIERPPEVQNFIDFLFAEPECIMLHVPHGGTLEDALKIFVEECVG